MTWWLDTLDAMLGELDATLGVAAVSSSVIERRLIRGSGYVQKKRPDKRQRNADTRIGWLVGWFVRDVLTRGRTLVL